MRGSVPEPTAAVNPARGPVGRGGVSARIQNEKVPLSDARQPGRHRKRSRPQSAFDRLLESRPGAAAETPPVGLAVPAAQRRTALRQFGFAATTALLYVLLIGATTSLCLGLLVLGGSLTVWNGLDFPIG